MDNFLDKAKTGLQKSVAFVVNKTQENVELHKSNTHIRELQRRHEECIKDLGYRVYAQMQRGELDMKVLRERFLVAMEIEKAIDRHHKEQGTIRERFKSEIQIFVPKDTPRCPKCNEIVMALTKFCHECGEPLDPKDKEKDKDVRRR